MAFTILPFSTLLLFHILIRSAMIWNLKWKTIEKKSAALQ